jgi:hypothetical protein
MPDGRDADAIHITRIAFLLVIHAVCKLKRGHTMLLSGNSLRIRKLHIACIIGSLCLPVSVSSASLQRGKLKIDHIVLVVLENHPYSQIINNPDAPFINSISKYGATFNNSHAVHHPSQPNYLALFSGSTQGISDDNDHSFSGDNLARALHRMGKSFAGYAETASPRKHNPWESFVGSESYGKPFSQFPTDPGRLPNVSFVIPNLENDMHDGSVKQADEWLRNNLRNYAKYCATHKSLLIITFDEDDYQSDNRIFSVLYGSMVRPKHYNQNITHYSVLRTIEDIEGIPPIGESANIDPIEGIWMERR